MADEQSQLKAILPFLQRADEVMKMEPKVAYYCRMYAVEVGVGFKPRAEKFTGVLTALMAKLEKDKAAAGLAADTDQDREYCRNFAEAVFARADKVDHAEKADKGTAMTFYAASIFIEVLRQFYNGELPQDLADIQKYAAFKAADIRKALREGRTPTPGNGKLPPEELLPGGELPTVPSNTADQPPPPPPPPPPGDDGGLPSVPGAPPSAQSFPSTQEPPPGGNFGICSSRVLPPPKQHGTGESPSPGGYDQQPGGYQQSPEGFGRQPSGHDVHQQPSGFDSQQRGGYGAPQQGRQAPQQDDSSHEPPSHGAHGPPAGSYGSASHVPLPPSGYDGVGNAPPSGADSVGSMPPSGGGYGDNGLPSAPSFTRSVSVASSADQQPVGHALAPRYPAGSRVLYDAFDQDQPVQGTVAKVDWQDNKWVYTVALAKQIVRVEEHILAPNFWPGEAVIFRHHEAADALPATVLSTDASHWRPSYHIRFASGDELEVGDEMLTPSQGTAAPPQDPAAVPDRSPFGAAAPQMPPGAPPYGQPQSPAAHRQGSASYPGAASHVPPPSGLRPSAPPPPPPPQLPRQPSAPRSPQRRQQPPSPAADPVAAFAPAPGFSPSLTAVTEAQKFAKYAASSLGFEDVATATKYLQDALRLLTQPS